MSEQDKIADQKARSRALDPATSFIVQAPAGSGKTGLLTQRFLVLLANVDAPEEIVAITFTRKAAGEMRQRILQALVFAKQNPPPEGSHEKLTWTLARQALGRDQKKGWHLLDNPSRLRIQTIDSLCTTLARQMPILSRFGSLPAIAEDATPLYLAAARSTISELEAGDIWSDAIAHLIQHLDNRLDKLQGLIVTMLARRDQWLRHIADPNHPALERENLEAAMSRLVTDALQELTKFAPDICRTELIELARFAADNAKEKNSVLANCIDLQKFPGQDITDRDQWEGLAALLLTKEGDWRKSKGLNKNNGFPAPSSSKNQTEKACYAEMKQRMTALLTALQDEDAFREQLVLLRELPPHQYNAEEWETLQALIKLLLVATAHLEIIFRTHAQVDFPALARAALEALGEPDEPTDLALALDYRIRHLLVDEFQDTSFNQYELLKRLTSGWQPGDGYSLFLVGDPMQSIYRFREAEVGLFLATREQGMSQMPLEFLRLTVNFRSQAGIVDWINQHFPKVLPVNDEIAVGAIKYAPSTIFHSQLKANAVTVYPVLNSLLKRDDVAEAKQIVSIIQQAKSMHPEGTTAILVRGRMHLVQIVAQLQKARFRFQAVEIERLAHRPVVQDLLALTRALIHLGDRIAWLAVLRAPYCGLTLKDLHILAGDDFHRCIIDLLHQAQRLEQLSDDGRQRLSRVLPVLDTALSEQARSSLRSSVEGTWIALGGPACVKHSTDLEDAAVYFQLLEKISNSGKMPDIEELNQKIEQLFALPDIEADNSLQLMTIHKAKGLEFDTVIIPGLDRSPRQEDEKLLHWLERGRESGDSDLLLAPISAQGEEKNPMAKYLQRLDKTKSRYEDGRLLYVAATRAKQHLHLLGQVGIQEQNGERTLKNPAQDSLLARLWPVIENDFQAFLGKQSIETQLFVDAAEPAVRSTERMRLALDWSLPPPPKAVQTMNITIQSVADESIEFDWAGETARHIGTIVHRLLQYIGKIGIEQLFPKDLLRFEQIGHNMLIQLGIPQNRLKNANETLQAALKAILEDNRGQWILSKQHEKASCELALSGIRNDNIDHLIIDRTFVDTHGTRWIIDYKTGTHTGSDIEEFLDREQARYQQQLERYASIMQKMEKRPIRLGLYFPLLRGWREWGF